MKAHNIKIEAFCYQKERGELQRKFENFLPKDAEVYRVEIAPETEGEIFLENLIVMKATLEKSKDTRSFLDKLRNNLSKEDIEILKDEVKNMIDSNCNFFIRIDKNSLRGGKITLNSFDSVHIKIKVAVYPSKTQDAINEVKRWLE